LGDLRSGDLTMALTNGTRLGPYEIVAPLGAGGMGEVYRARDARLNREVAVKVVAQRLAGEPELKARFEREARAVAALNHPNILAIHDVGEEGGILFAVTELLEGQTLRLWLLGAAPNWKKAAAIGRAVAEGLAAAHAKGIVHRDVKPENLFITRDGRIKVLDFGLAHTTPPLLLGSASGTPTLAPETHAGVLLGTVGYLSPEQVRGLPADSRSDIFALGCVVFEVATGERAFSGSSAAETLSETLHHDPRERLGPLAETAPAFVQVLARCLEKDSENRFQSMSDLAFAFGLVLEESKSRRAKGREGESALPGVGAPPAALAVLPFVNRSPDPENEYFSDGMTEELIGALSRVPGLRVASRTSVFALKGRIQDVRELGRTLGATAILEGSVRRAGERMRLTAQLTSVADGYQLWAETYDRDIRDVFAVQDDIANTIVATLRDRLGLSAPTPAPRRPDTQNVRAYQLYLKGRHFWARRTPETRMKAVRFFEEAIAADPEYARAYAGLADCYQERGGGVGGRAEEVIARARPAALRALEIDDSLADAHTSLGRILLYFDWNWTAAETEFRRSIELDPLYWEAHHSYSHYLLPAGRVAESLEASRKALELEPLDLGINTHLGWHYLYSGDFDRAAEQCRVCIEMDPSFFYAHFYLGMAYEQQGEDAKALAELEEAVRLSPQSAEAAAGRIRLLVAAGRRREAEAALEELCRREESSIAYEIGVARLGFGETDRALDAFEKALADRAERMIDMGIDPRLRPLHSHPRFREIAQRVGIPVMP
jgi:serine/threonine-protein kinase